MSNVTTSTPPAVGCVPPSTILKTQAEENGIGTHPADDYRKFLVEHWAGAFVDGPMKTIEQYDRAAKLLVTVVTPLQAVLFAAYGLLVPKALEASPDLQASPDWFTSLLLILFVASVAGVFVCVVYVCNERPKLTVGDRGLLSSLLADKTALPTALPEAVRSWENHIENVAACKHWWLTMGFCCFFAGSLVAVTVLIYFSLSARGWVYLSGSILLGAAILYFVRRHYALKKQAGENCCTT